MNIRLLLGVAVSVTHTSSCLFDAGKIGQNQGTPPTNYTFGALSFSLKYSSTGCDATVHCSGFSPLAFMLYYSSTADGKNPIFDSNLAALLSSQSLTSTPEFSSFDFQYLRNVGDDWIVYLPDIDYLAVNDPNGDPSSWVAYNNIVCIQSEFQMPTTTEYVATTTAEPDMTTATESVVTTTTESVVTTTTESVVTTTTESVVTTTTEPFVTTSTQSYTTTGAEIRQPDKYCNCAIINGWFDSWNPAQIWVDLIFIIDTSSSMGDSLEEAKSLLTSFIPLMSTDTTGSFYSRIGVIAASDTIEVIYNLNMSSTDNLDSIKQNNVDKIDVEGAFRAASQMFAYGTEVPSYRENAKQIIYYLTNSAPSANLNGVHDFKTGGGIVIVNDFVLEGEVADPTLKNIASDNFYFWNLSEDYLSSLAVICEANCFCNPSKHAFNDDEISPRTQANRGCYHPVDNGIPQPKARETCTKEGAELVSIHDDENEFFVNSVVSVFGPKKKYWLGIEYDQKSGSWIWDDLYNSQFSDWNANQPDTKGGTLQCAYAQQTTGLNVRWTAANCAMGGVIYVCESTPCSVGNKVC